MNYSPERKPLRVWYTTSWVNS